MIQRPHRILLVAAAAVLLLAGAAASPWQARLLYNPSASAPRGWYLRKPLHALRPGMLVLATLPAPVAGHAERRGYLPRTVPLLKRVGALAPQHVCVRGGRVRIDGRVVGGVRSRDGSGRPLAPWPGCRQLRPDEVFLLGTGSAASFDSRYFGPLPRTAVAGQAVPLWTW